MQCGNCRFQNMPGSDVCGRCGTSLRLATAVIDVRPPRASPLARRLRKVGRAVPVGRTYYAARDAVADGRVFRFAPAWHLPVEQLLSAMTVRLAVPGWSHFRLGRRALGHAILWGYLACLVPGLLLMGTGAGSVLLGLAFSVHSSAATDVVNRCMAACGTWGRVGRGLLVSLALAVVIYWPAGALLTRVADPHTIHAAFGPFQAGDIVLVNHWRAAGPGRVVLYDLPPTRLPIRGRHAYVFYAGERIDRVLAGPGDYVAWDGHGLAVNGAPSPLLPLQPQKVSVRFEGVVPPGHLFILPSAEQMMPDAQDTGTWKKLAFVPQENVRGGPYACKYPPGRLRVLR